MYVLFKNGDLLYLLPCYFEGYFETHLPQPSPPTPTVRLVLGKSHPSKGTTPQGAHPWLREFFSTTFLAQNQLEVGLVSSTYSPEAFAQFPSVDLLMG